MVQVFVSVVAHVHMEGFQVYATSNGNKGRVHTGTSVSSAASLAGDFPLPSDYSPRLAFSAPSHDNSTHENGTCNRSGLDFVINLVQGFRLSGDYTSATAAATSTTSSFSSTATSRTGDIGTTTQQGVESQQSERSGAYTSGVTSSDRAALSATLLSRLVTGALQKLERDLWSLHCSSENEMHADLRAGFTPAPPHASPRVRGGAWDISNHARFSISAKASLEPMIEAGIFALKWLPLNVRTMHEAESVGLIAHHCF